MSERGTSERTMKVATSERRRSEELSVIDRATKEPGR
jgi:hypothetical protein